MRILNRLGQGYLVRRSAPLPVVGAPGRDLEGSAGWVITAGDATAGVYNITSSVEPGYSLSAEEGSLAVDAGSGSWRFRSVGDGTTYQYITEPAEPTRGLRVDGPAGSSGSDLQVVFGEIEAGDPAAMWRLEDECVADARSIHLRYPWDSDVSVFYNEIYPQAAPPGTFFCTSGFCTGPQSPGPSGYGGIQQRPDGSQIAIFSVWHRMADEETPVADAFATTVAMNPRATGTAFSGEGSGSSIRYPMPWQVGSKDPIRFTVTAEAVGRDTVLSGYVAHGNEPWISLGSILRAETGGRLLTGLYGFIEDFARNGSVPGIPADERSPYRLHRGVFANPFVGTAGSTFDVEPLYQAKVTVYSPHPLENLSAEPVAEAAFGVLVTTGTSRLVIPSTIGATIIDPAPARRTLPNLNGVPID